MISTKRATFYAVVLTALMFISGEVAKANCNATVNGRPMSQQLCTLNMQVYGMVIPGNYLMDDYGNWVSINNPMLRGNILRDAQGRQRNSTTNYSGQNYRGPFGDYMSDGRCSFVNGIPVGDCD